MRLCNMLVRMLCEREGVVGGHIPAVLNAAIPPCPNPNIITSLAS